MDASGCGTKSHMNSGEKELERQMEMRSLTTEPKDETCNKERQDMEARPRLRINTSWQEKRSRSVRRSRPEDVLRLALLYDSQHQFIVCKGHMPFRLHYYVGGTGQYACVIADAGERLRLGDNFDLAYIKDSLRRGSPTDLSRDAPDKKQTYLQIRGLRTIQEDTRDGTSSYLLVCDCLGCLAVSKATIDTALTQIAARKVWYKV